MRGLALSFVTCAVLGFAAAQEDELKIEVTKAVKCDRKTKSGDNIRVNYNGTLTSGRAFDSSYSDKGSEPFEFHLGAGDVIKGWDQGLLDMCIGERRKLTIPPKLAYGDRGAGSAVPPNSTLIFSTELMGIEGVAKPM